MTNKFYLSKNARRFCKDKKILSVIRKISPSSLKFYHNEDEDVRLASCDSKVIKDALRDIMGEVYGWPKARVIDEYVLQAVLDEVPVCLVTSEDSGKEFEPNDEVPTPFFSKGKMWQSEVGYYVLKNHNDNDVKSCVHVPQPNETDKRETPDDKSVYVHTDALGCYVSVCQKNKDEAGIIYLWIDKIYKAAQYATAEPNLSGMLDVPANYFWCLLHKVMLHEYIHAIFGIDYRLKRVNSNWSDNSSQYGMLDEESLDNALLLYAYALGASSYQLKYAIWYIANRQAGAYWSSLKLLGIIDENGIVNDIHDFDKWVRDSRAKMVQYIQKLITADTL